MKIINKYDKNILTALNYHLNLEIPLEPEKFIHIFNTYPNEAIYHRLDLILDDFPNMPVIQLLCKRTSEGDYQQYMFKDDWSRVVRLLREDRHVIWFISPEDYIQVAPGFQVIQRKGNGGVSEIIWKICNNLKNPNTISPMDFHLTNWFISQGHNKASAERKINEYNQLFAPRIADDEQMKHFYQRVKQSQEFRGRIDIIFSGLDVDNLGIVQEIKGFTERDLYKMKLLYVLYFQAYPSLTMIREFRGISEPNTFERTQEQHNPRQGAEDFIDACRNFIKIDIDIDKIYTDIEEIQLSTDFIDSMFGYDEDGEMIIKDTTSVE